MALNGLAQVFGNGLDLIPHVEMGAIRWTQRMYVMPSRVANFTDMSGWNVRKISEYLKYRRAVELQEDTDIPDTKLARKRKVSVEPEEFGDRYRISDRREDTDLENIVADTIEALGRAIGDRKEQRFFEAALASFRGGTLGSSSTDYSIALPIDAQHEFAHRARRGLIYHVMHPFQAKTVLKDLVQFNGANAGANLDFRNSAISAWKVPGFDGLNIAISDFVPRRVIHNMKVYGTGGTFRLAVKDGRTIGEDVTAAITVSGTTATMQANIKAALEALTFDGNGTWTLSGASNTAIVVTPPATLYLDAESELRVAIDYDDPTLDGEKSAYDLVTSLSDAPEDVNGDSIGVEVTEKSASAKSLLFFRDALIHDIRKPVRANFELVHQGRTAEYAAYETAAIAGWRGELGMFIETKANSAFASG